MESSGNDKGSLTIGLTLLQSRNRFAVRLGKDMERVGIRIFDEKETIVGYVFREDGYYHKHYLAPDMDNIARFLCSSSKDKLLCNGQDYGIACSMGTYLDLSVDSFREKILPFLEKYQRMGKYQEFQELG